MKEFLTPGVESGKKRKGGITRRDVLKAGIAAAVLGASAFNGGCDSHDDTPESIEDTAKRMKESMEKSETEEMITRKSLKNPYAGYDLNSWLKGNREESEEKKKEAIKYFNENK